MVLSNMGPLRIWMIRISKITTLDFKVDSGMVFTVHLRKVRTLYSVQLND